MAQFRELEAFAQFASDLDETSRNQLERGQRLVEVLKQPAHQPLPVEKQVVIIYAGTKGYLDDLPVRSIRKFEDEIYPFIETKYPQIFENIRTKKQIDAQTEELLKKTLEEFKAQFSTEG